MYLIFCRFTLLKYNTSHLCYFEQERKLILATVHILTYDTLEVCLYWPIRWEHTPVISCAEIVDPHLTLFSGLPPTFLLQIPDSSVIYHILIYNQPCSTSSRARVTKDEVCVTENTQEISGISITTNHFYFKFHCLCQRFLTQQAASFLRKGELRFVVVW